MTHRALRFVFATLGLAAGMLAMALPAGAQPNAEARRLHEVMEQYFEDELRLDPVLASSIGDRRYDDRYPVPIGEAHRKAQRAHCRRYLGALAQLQRGELDAPDQLSYDLLERTLARRIEGLAFDSHLQPVTQLAGAPVEFALLGSGRGSHPFRSTADYENFLARIDGFQEWVETAIANMRRGMEQGIVQPGAVMQRALPQLEAMTVDDPARNPFYEPLRLLPELVPGPGRAPLATAYTRAIRERIVPAYRKLRDFIRDEYLPRARAGVALSELPDGAAWYRHLVRLHTTTELAPDDIFRLGEEEIARIGKEMERVRAQGAFRDAPAGYGNRDDLLKGYEALRAIVTPRLPRLFGRLPGTPYEIRILEPFREHAAPSHYRAGAPDGSRPGVFYVNAAGIGTQARAVSESLFLHEAVPGHHLQLSIQREREDLPRWRRFGGYTAFVEGWALYAESLGAELGLHTEPRQQHERLGAELFRAVRLVVDVGLHHKGWSRQRALRFMSDATGSGDSGAAREIDRYIADPAQALAYKVGQLRISALRARAEAALGVKFDLRAFHDELLRDGALPLDLLEAKMEAWLARARAGVQPFASRSMSAVLSQRPWPREHRRP